MLAKSCQEISDRDLLLSIQEFIHLKSSVPSGSPEIKIPVDELNAHVAKKYTCALDRPGQEKIIAQTKKIIEQRNKHFSAMNKSTRFIIVPSIFLQPIKTPAHVPFSTAEKAFLNVPQSNPHSKPPSQAPNPIIPPRVPEKAPLRPPMRPTPERANPSAMASYYFTPEQIKAVQAQEEEARQLRIDEEDELLAEEQAYQEALSTGRPWKPVSQQEFDRRVSKRHRQRLFQERQSGTYRPYEGPEISFLNRRHGQLGCSPDHSCPPYYACDLDTEKCLSTDHIPPGTWISHQNKRLTGSGKKLVDYLLAQGVSREDILAKKFPTTPYMDEYLQKFSPPVQARKELVTFNDLSRTFSEVITAQNFNLSTRGWPPGVSMIPDFLSSSQQHQLFTYLERFSNREFKTAQVPPPLACLALFLMKHKFSETQLEKISIRSYPAGSGSPGQPTSSSLILSLGSPLLMRFSGPTKSVELPLLPGSLLILPTSSQWTHEVTATLKDSYTPRNLPTQSWLRKDHISLVFSP